MQKPNNYTLILTLLTILTTTWIGPLPEANAQDTSYRSQAASFKLQAFPMCRDYEQHTASYMLQASNCQLQTNNCTLNNANCKLQIEQETPLLYPQSEIPMSFIGTANYPLPSTINHDPSTLNLLPDTTDSRLKTISPTAPSSRQAPRLNASGHGALTETKSQLPIANRKLPSPYSRLKTNDSTLNLELSTSLITGSARSLPFHLHTNRLGTIDPGSTNFLNRFRATGNLYKSKNLKMDYGADLALRISENSTAFFPELYVGAEYGAFRLDFGRFDRPIGLNNHNLSIGSMMVSRNAVPITRIMLSTPDFTTVPWTNDLLEFKAMYSHGWFTDERHVDSPYLHQKYLYLKLNATKSFSVVGGIIHNVQWGGNHPVFGKTPLTLQNYINVVLSIDANISSFDDEGELISQPENHLAAYEFGMFYEADTYAFSITRLFYLEDSVSKRLRSPWDGVWGVNLEFHNQNRILNAITYEHVNTRRQDAKADQERGRANYYGHGHYRTGWFYENRSIGLPLIIKNEETNRLNNIIVGHHLGLVGELSNIFGYKLLTTYSRNYGTLRPLYKVPRGTIDYAERREDRYSFLFEMNYAPKGMKSISFNIQAAFDAGEFRESSFGGMAGVTISI